MRKTSGVLGLLLGLILAACFPGDTLKPTVTIQSPSDNQTVSQATLTVQGTAQDNVGVTRLTYQLNGGPEQQVNITPGQQVSFQFQVTLQQGQNTLTVNAYDQAGNKGSATVRVTYDPQAVHTLSGMVVSEYAGAPVSGTSLKLYRENQLVGTAQSDSEGRFAFSGLPPGRYRLEAQKPGMAGSVVEGIIVPQMNAITLIQRRAFDASLSTTPPTLIVTDGAGSPLDNRSFTNSIPFQVRVDATRDLVRPMRYIYVALGRTPGAAFITNSATWQRRIFIETEDTGPQTLSGASVAGFGSASGEGVYLEVVAYDFNYNRSHYLIPLTFINTSTTQNNTVVAPTSVAATAITLSQAVGFFNVKAPLTLTVPLGRNHMGELLLDLQGVPEGSNLYVEVRWCYTNTATSARPFAFRIERSTDGQNWITVGRVGGGASSSCPTNPFNRPFFFRDASPDLTPGRTYLYRVVAVGSNEAPSAPSSTTPLPPYSAPLLRPEDESKGVSRTPNFVIGHPQLQIGADGAGYNLVLWDTLTGDSVAWQTLAGYSLLVEFGTGPEGNGIPQGEALVYSAFGVHTDTAGLLDPSRPNQILVNVIQGEITIPYNFDGLAQLPALQALRTYAWQLYVSYAYKYEGNRIGAYSIQTWPSSTSFIRISRPSTQVFDFTTGE